MSEQIIDTVTRRAADAVSRRASILALGGVALAALTAVPAAAKGGKGGKGKGKKKGKNRKNGNGGTGNIVNPGPTGQEIAQVRCAAQGDQCRTSLTAICAGEPQCLEGLACCDLFATCDAAGGLTCIIG
jgi:hypothetical protein